MLPVQNVSLNCTWAGHPASGGLRASWASLAPSGRAWHWAAGWTQVLFVVLATHWTLWGPHVHKGMFGWIHYTATHTARLPVWVHDSNQTSKLGQRGSCSAVVGWAEGKEAARGRETLERQSNCSGSGGSQAETFKCTRCCPGDAGEETRTVC